MAVRAITSSIIVISKAESLSNVARVANWSRESHLVGEHLAGASGPHAKI